MDALPPDLVQQIKQKQVDLDDPATTLALLKLNAVVGVQGLPGSRRQAAVGRHHLRHLPLDGGRRLRPRHRPPARRLAEPRPGHRQDHHAGPEPEAADGPPRRSARTSLKKALLAWGPGKYDAELLHDGKAVSPGRQDRRHACCPPRSAWPG